MADLSITAADVVQVSGNKPIGGTLGVAGTAGQTVFINGSKQLALAKADTAPNAAAAGILLTSGGVGQPALYQSAGIINLGATLVVGETYTISPNNAGGIAPVSDLATGDFVQILCTAISTSEALIINMGANPPVAHA